MRKGKKLEGLRKWYMKAIGGGYRLHVGGVSKCGRNRGKGADEREEAQRPLDIVGRPDVELLDRESVRLLVGSAPNEPLDLRLQRLHGTDFSLRRGEFESRRLRVRRGKRVLKATEYEIS